jgi:hypothetical protein
MLVVLGLPSYSTPLLQHLAVKHVGIPLRHQNREDELDKQ